MFGGLVLTLVVLMVSTGSTGRSRGRGCGRGRGRGREDISREEVPVIEKKVNKQKEANIASSSQRQARGRGSRPGTVTVRDVLSKIPAVREGVIENEIHYVNLSQTLEDMPRKYYDLEFENEEQYMEKIMQMNKALKERGLKLIQLVEFEKSDVDDQSVERQSLLIGGKNPQSSQGSTGGSTSRGKEKLGPSIDEGSSSRPECMRCHRRHLGRCGCFRCGNKHHRIANCPYPYGSPFGGTSSQKSVQQTKFLDKGKGKMGEPSTSSASGQKEK